MSDPLGLSEGVKGLSSGLDSAREAGKTVSKQIENIQKDAVDVAKQQAQDRIRARRETEFKKERALVKALEEWKRKKQISDEEANLKIKFVKQYGAKEWDALLRIKLDIENMERKNNEEFQHDLKAIRRVQFYCFVAALVVTLWLKFILGAFQMETQQNAKSALIEKVTFAILPLLFTCVVYLMSALSNLSHEVTVLNSKISLVVTSDNKQSVNTGAELARERLRQELSIEIQKNRDDIQYNRQKIAVIETKMEKR